MKNEQGEDLGVMQNRHAQEMAYESGLDLVEIAPDAKPPVCQIMDFGKFRFEKKKKQKEQAQRNKAVLGKEIRLRPVSNEHDVDIKINQLKKFLGEKRTVQVCVMFKNREIMFKDEGIKILKKIIQAVDDCGKVEGQMRFEGKNLNVRFLPK